MKGGGLLTLRNRSLMTFWQADGNVCYYRVVTFGCWLLTSCPLYHPIIHSWIHVGFSCLFVLKGVGALRQEHQRPGGIDCVCFGCWYVCFRLCRKALVARGGDYERVVWFVWSADYNILINSCDVSCLLSSGVFGLWDWSANAEGGSIVLSNCWYIYIYICYRKEALVGWWFSASCGGVHRRSDNLLIISCDFSCLFLFLSFFQVFLGFESVECLFQLLWDACDTQSWGAGGECGDVRGVPCGWYALGGQLINLINSWYLWFISFLIFLSSPTFTLVYIYIWQWYNTRVGR